MVLAAAKRDVLVTVEPQQFEQRLARRQHAVGLGDAGHLHLDQGQAVAVGRHQLDCALLELEQRTVQLEPRLFGGHGEDHLADHALEVSEGHLERSRGGVRIDRGQCRKVLGRETVDAEPRGAGNDVERVGLAGRQLDRTISEGADDLQELARLNRRGSRLAGALFGRAGRSERDIEIRRRQFQPVLPNPQQEVGQHRNRRPALHDAAHRDEFGQQLSSFNPGLHLRSPQEANIHHPSSRNRRP